MATPSFTPIQVVLDVRTYQDARIRTGFPTYTDFFKDRDEAFARHKEEISKSLSDAARLLKQQKGGAVGYLKVSMRNDALAKSHRPKTLFPSRATVVAGIDDVGELLIQVNDGAISRAVQQVELAELHVETVTRIDKEGNSIAVATPSPYRAETGAIEKISLWSAGDKRSFSAERAIKWAGTQKLALRYRVDLFDFEIPKDKATKTEIGNFQARDIFFSDLADHLQGGYFAISYKPTVHTNERIYIWLVQDKNMQTITTLRQAKGSIPAPSECDTSLTRHESLLKFLDSSVLVRRVSLPSAFRHSHSQAGAARGQSKPHSFSLPLAEGDYPAIGIIDGGVSGVPKEWVRYVSSPIPPSDRSDSHGSEIASLLVDGQRLNHPSICPEPDGCYLADLSLIPTEDFFSKHYHGGDIEFLNSLEVEVRKAKEATGARIFCFSLNLIEEIDGRHYDEVSLGLDNIALRNNVVFVISAGNLASGTYRTEWGDNSTSVLSSLASANNDRIKAPADSIFNLSVSALNPTVLAGEHSGAPARYSRRGPGYKFTVKPDLTHFGGAGPFSAGDSTGLAAVNERNSVIWVHGTSYSAPLVAKTLARLNHLTKGELSREALIALVLHSSTIPAVLHHKDYVSIRRDLVGFGMPPPAQEFLDGSATSATLVFSDVLQPKKDLFFKFSWPNCLSNEGACRGHARITLVYSPPVADKFGPEMVRINLDVSLQQYQPAQKNYKKRTESVFKSKTAVTHQFENDLLVEGLKWNNMKQATFTSPKGVGKSSDWQLKVDYLERNDQLFPEEGIPFTAILTISDPKEVQPVYQDMRTNLTANNVRMEDIHVFAENRIRNSKK